MRLIMMLFAASVTLSGCMVSAKDGDTHVVVSDGDRYNNGDFCPPGQAKKGRC